MGKTTTVVNVAAALAKKNLRVLAIDMDPQAHLTIHLGWDAEQADSGAYRVLTGSAELGSVVRLVRPNLWLLPAGVDLVSAEMELVNEVGRETVLSRAVESIGEHFDYVFVDCPPSLGLLTLNALAAVDEVVIPIQPHFLALQGLSRLLGTIALINGRINPSLRVSSILMCMFDSRISLAGEVKADIEKFLQSSREQNCPWAGAKLAPVQIRRNIKLAEAPSYGKTIFEYEPSCNGAFDYQALAEYLHTGTTAEPAIRQTETTGQAS